MDTVKIEVASGEHRFSLRALRERRLFLRVCVVREEIEWRGGPIWGLAIEGSTDGNLWTRVDHHDASNIGTLWLLTYTDDSKTPILFSADYHTASANEFCKCRPSNNWTCAIWKMLSQAVADKFGYKGEFEFDFEPADEDGSQFSVTVT